MIKNATIYQYDKVISISKIFLMHRIELSISNNIHTVYVKEHIGLYVNK